jgi:hypothetical protein
MLVSKYNSTMNVISVMIYFFNEAYTEPTFLLFSDRDGLRLADVLGLERDRTNVGPLHLSPHTRGTAR